MIEVVGEGVTAFVPGDRVAAIGSLQGAYATERNLPAQDLFRLPHGISEEQAVAMMLKGCTAEFLIERCARLVMGDVVLVHAAAGGVGQILVQWLLHLGIRVIATVSTEAKAERARWELST